MESRAEEWWRGGQAPSLPIIESRCLAVRISLHICRSSHEAVSTVVWDHWWRHRRLGSGRGTARPWI
jgi:hypothetical protein